jgi:hypothetical protein
MKAVWLLAVSGTLLLIVGGTYIAPLTQTHKKQDECSFGPVTNDRYRQLLAEARIRQTTTWPPLTRDNTAIRLQLNGRVDELSGPNPSPFEKLAAMHAVLRALGGEFRRTTPGAEWAVRRGSSGSGVVTYDYHLDVNRIGFFALGRREAWIVGRFIVVSDINPGHLTDPRRANLGDVQFDVALPTWLDDYHLAETDGSTCPFTPTISALGNFESAES